MKNQFLLAAFAILYQVSQSNSWVNEQLESFDPRNLERKSYKEAHDKYEEISIKKEGGLKKLVPFSNKSNQAMNNKFNPKKEKLNELRRLRKSRSNETSVTGSNKDIIKIQKFISDFNLQYPVRSSFNENQTNENLEETNLKIKPKEEFKDTNSSHTQNMLHSQPMSLSRDYVEPNKEIDSSSGDQDLKTGYKDHRKQHQFRHLWGQDRSIHSYRSASMHKKPFWYSPYHFPRAKVTVAGLNIPWFRLRSTYPGQHNFHKEPVQRSNPDNTFQIQHNNTSNVLPTLAPIEIRVTKNANVAEQSIRINLPSQTPRSPLPHWPNFYKNMDHPTSEKSLKVYKSVRVPTKAESVETEKNTVHSTSEGGTDASVSQKTTQVQFNGNYKKVNYRQYENKNTAGNTNRTSSPGSNDVEVTTVDNFRSTYIILQNTTPMGFMTPLKHIREPQWPPWPRWLSEPLQKNKNVFNNSYVLNHYTANVYSNDEKSVILSSVKLNDATETIKKIDTSEEPELFFDIASTYNGLTANIAELLPLTTGIRVVATTEANDYINIIDNKSHYNENSSALLPNLRNIVRCTQGCPLTPEFNPVCGTDDITYTNPGRLLCLQFCGLDVKVKKYQPCSSKHKLSEYPNMVNLFINTAVESLRATVKANTSTSRATVKDKPLTPRATATPRATVKASAPTTKATVKANYASTPSPTNSTTVYYVRYDSFSINDEDEDSTETKTALETTTEMASYHTLLAETTVVTPTSGNIYIENLRDLINLNTDYNKHQDSKSITIHGLSQVKEVPLSNKKIKSNLAALNSILKHSGRDVSTKAVHAVTYSPRDVATKRFAVTRAIKDASTKKLTRTDFLTNSRKSSSSNNNLSFKQDTPHVDALDGVDEQNNNGRRYVESPFVDLPYSSGEYVSPDENANESFQDIQKESDDVDDADDAGDDMDSKFWRFQSEKEKHNGKEQIQSKDKKHKRFMN